MSEKEKLIRVCQALDTLYVAGNSNVKTLAGIFAILEEVINAMNQAEKETAHAGGGNNE